MKDAGQRIAENALETAVAMQKVQRQSIMDEEDVTARAVNDERERCLGIVEKQIAAKFDSLPFSERRISGDMLVILEQNIIKRIKKGK